MNNVFDIGTMFAASTSSWLSLAVLVGVASYIAGAWLMIGSLVDLTRLEGGRVTGKAVMFKALAATLFFALPSTVMTMQHSFGMENTTENILAGTFAAPQGAGAHCGAMSGVFAFIALVGLIAMFRGILRLKEHGGERRDGALFSAFTHLAGGSLAMNLPWLAQVLANSSIIGGATLKVMCVA
jgi:hypothetical protein